MLRNLLSLLALAGCAMAASESSDSDLMPIGGFIPRVYPAAIAFGFYAISTVLFWKNFIKHGKQKYMLVGCIGMTVISLGFAIKIGDAIVQKTSKNMGIYIVFYTLVLLSPCAFLAQDYVLIQRLALCLPSDVSRKCFIIPARRVVLIFVLTDVFTFLLQAAGGGIQATNTPSQVKLGQKIALIGLGLQLASFGFFTIALLLFGHRLRSLYPALWNGSDANGNVSVESERAGKNWRKLYWIVVATTVGILIRSVFRIAEFAEGFLGYLATHEIYFYFLDALPLWIAMTLYCFVWPPVQLEGRDEMKSDLVLETKETSTA